MNSTLNGHGQEALISLAARLTDPGDRERYAAVLSYVQRLPPADEFRQLVDLMGSLVLLTQHIPDAMAEFLEAFRQETITAGEYHAQVNERLAQLPQEIAAGVDPSAIAEAMSESFRQQVTATGLTDAAALLNASAADCKAVSANIATTLKLPQQYKGVAATISAELAKLTAASTQLQQHNARLIEQERQASWLWVGTVAVVLFLAGGFCGILFEQSQTTDLLTNIGTQIQRIQTAMVPAPPPLKLHSGTTKTQSSQSERNLQ